MPHQPPKLPPTMDKYTRKSKPRTAAPTSAAPTHVVTPAPRALVCPTSAAPVAHRRTTAPAAPPSDDALPRLPPLPGAAAEQASTSPAPVAPKPRKRFRKKVNGLFGDHTDLKKRMSRLLRPADPSQLLAALSFRSDSRPIPACSMPAASHPSATTELPPARAVVEKLKASTLSTNNSMTTPATVTLAIRTSHADSREKEKNSQTPSIPLAEDATVDEDSQSLLSFDLPAFVATASRVLGSPERLRAVRRNMGRLSPQSNARFLEEVQVGVDDEKPRARAKQEDGTITPPHLPSVDSSEFEVEEPEVVREAHALSPVSVERTGAPAVLRRKVRRLDRGYRSEDVLRARLAGMPISEFAASPTVQRRADRSGKWNRSKVRRLDLGRAGEPVSERDGSRNKRRAMGERLRMEESQMDSTEEEDGGHLSADGAPPKKSRRLRSGSKAGTDGAGQDTGRTGRAFAMLVEAAVVQQKQSTASPKSRTRQLESSGRRASQERPRKKRKGSSHRVYVD